MSHGPDERQVMPGRRLRGDRGAVGFVVALWACALLAISPAVDGAAWAARSNRHRSKKKGSTKLRPKVPSQLVRITSAIRAGCKPRSRQPAYLHGKRLTLEGILDAAEDPVHQAFVRRLVDEIRKAIGGEVNGKHRIKERARAEEKVRDKYGGDVRRLRDASRDAISFPYIEDAYRAADFVKQLEANPAFEGMKIVQEKDRMARPAESGYSDLKLYIRDPGGYVFELQLLNGPMEALERLERLEYKKRRAGLVDSYDLSIERSRSLFAAGLALVLNSPPSWVEWPAISLPPQAGDIRGQLKDEVYHFMDEVGEPLQNSAMPGFLRYEARDSTEALEVALKGSFVKSAKQIVTVKDHGPMVEAIRRGTETDARRMLDVLQGSTLCDTLRQCYLGLANLNRMEGCQFVHFNDKFASHAPPGWQELDRYPQIVANVQLTPKTPIAEVRVELKALNAVRHAFQPVIDAHLSGFIDSAHPPHMNDGTRNHRPITSKVGHVHPQVIKTLANTDSLYRAVLGILGY